MEIKTLADLDEALSQGKYTSIGSYPIFFITADGGVLSYDTVKEERETIAEAIEDDDTSGGWRVNAADVNWEDPDLIDDHTGERIESAYAEDEHEESDDDG